MKKGQKKPSLTNNVMKLTPKALLLMVRLGSYSSG